jgi:choline dehydrogenase
LLGAEPEHDYVIVGSGAGGGTLAARLAEVGMRVVLLDRSFGLEAGGDPRSDRLSVDYEVPGFHPFASENPAMSIFPTVPPSPLPSARQAHCENRISSAWRC